MKSIFLFIVVLLTSSSSFAQHATIKIDVERSIGAIDPKIYGVFMEPITISGRRGLPDSPHLSTLYGTLYDPASPLANEDGFRKDYIDAMKDLKVTNMRWPGGNFLMGYDWRDGIGPKEQRPARINLAWGGIDNHVGTDEWFALNKAIGSENIVCANLGLASIMDAAYWVEYCNYKGGTYYSDLRIKNGHKEPYKVKIWDLGNEVDGKPWELGHKNVEDYIEVAREAAKAMSAVDSKIEFVGCGSSWYSKHKWDDWNRAVLKGIGDKIKYLSIHSYWENSTDYYTHMGDGARIFEDRITITEGEIKAVSNTEGYKHPIYLSIDEWGAFGRNMMSVLPVAQSFNAFIRHADVVKMTNFTLMTSLLASDPKKGSYRSPLYYTFKMFSNNCLGNAIDTYVQCDTFGTAQYRGIPFLDVSTTYSKETGKVFINVVNRHKDNAITADITSTTGNFGSRAEASVVYTADLQQAFEYDKQDQYIPAKKDINTKANQFSFSFPPHSFTQIAVSVDHKP
jgi:alpha-N-arabinofuranosidase